MRRQQSDEETSSRVKVARISLKTHTRTHTHGYDEYDERFALRKLHTLQREKWLATEPTVTEVPRKWR